MSWEEKMLKEIGTALAKISIRSAVSSDLDQITHALCEAAETSSDKVDEIKCIAEKATAMPEGCDAE